MSITYHVHSIDLEIKQEYLSEIMTPLPDVHVGYKIYYNGKVVAVQTSFPIDIPEKIINWTALKDEIRKACEKDSKRWIRPGWRGSGRVTDDPLEVLEMENQQVYKK